MSENPGPLSIEKLMENIKDGFYVVPDFQRDFEWRPKMVCELIESILQNYFSGLLLFWELDSEKVGDIWDPIWGTIKKPNPREVVLDGQQRLSSLYYAFYNPNIIFPKTKSFYLFHLNIVQILKNDFEDAVTYRYHKNHKTWNEIETERENWIKSGEIPLTVLSAKDPTNSSVRYIDSNEFYEWSVKFIEEKKASNEIPASINPNTLRSIFTSLLAFNFVYFTLSKERQLEDVCNIFARINQKGMRLTTFDLMNAFLRPQGVRLRKELWDNLNNEPLKSIERKMNEYILKTISLFKQNYCSTKYIYNLIPKKEISQYKGGKKKTTILVKDGTDFENLWTKSCKFCEKARQKLMNTGPRDFGAIKKNFIPNSTMIPELGAILWFLNQQKKDPNDKKFNDKLKEWYWPTVLSEEYSGSSDSVMGKDFRNWSSYIKDDLEFELDDRITEARSNLNLKNTNKGSARYNAILCLLNKNGAKDFLSGRIVGSGTFSHHKINDHHIFPIKVEGLDPTKSNLFSDFKNSILNRTLILDETNQIIMNNKPSIYIAELITKLGDEGKVKSIMESHLISNGAYDYMKNDDFDNFLKEREKSITDYIHKILS